MWSVKLPLIPIPIWVTVLTVLWSSIAFGHPTEYESYAQAYTHPEYSFSYGVKDPHTGDVKHQWEKRYGDTVKGLYSLVEPDGSVRTVSYSADDKSGFNAVVKTSGVHYHPEGKPSSHSQFYIESSGHEGSHSSGHEGSYSSGHEGSHSSGHEGSHSSGHEGSYSPGHEGSYYAGHEGSYSPNHEESYSSGHEESYAPEHSYKESSSSYEEEQEPPSYDTKVQYKYAPSKNTPEKKNELKASSHEELEYDADDNKPKVLSHFYAPQQSYFYMNTKQLPESNKLPLANHNDKKIHKNLPTDLSPIVKSKGSSVKNTNDQKLIPLEVTVLKPIEIDLDLSHISDAHLYKPNHGIKSHKHQPNFNPKPQTELDYSLLKNPAQLQYASPSSNKFVKSSPYSQQELTAIKQFYGQENSYLQDYQFKEPSIEGGFKPITKLKLQAPRPNNIPPVYRPGLLKSGKKPFTTPGLRNYSTSRGYVKYVFPPQPETHGKGNRPYYPNPKGPILFPPNPDDRKGEVPNLYKRMINGGHLTYAKHVRYED